MNDARTAELTDLGLLSLTGEDARTFLHGQLSNDIAALSPNEVRYAGYCSPKGRLLADFLVIPAPEGFLLQVSRDIAAAMTRRLAMFILRAKAKVTDASDTCLQFGLWGPDAPQILSNAGLPVPGLRLGLLRADEVAVVSLCTENESRFLLIGTEDLRTRLGSIAKQGSVQEWLLADVRAGLPRITLATQDQFVPQMANLELIGGIDFKKGCYPGQEIVARTQYLGKLKRRMYRLQTDDLEARAGLELFSAAGDAQPVGTVVSAALTGSGGMELLAVLQTSSAEAGAQLHLGTPGGAQVHLATLPYTVPSP